MITAIYIKNFKAFKTADISPANLTLLPGLNGTGKSTVIQSLLLLRQSFLKQTLPYVGLTLNGDYVAIGNGKDALCWDSETQDLYFEVEWDRQFLTKFDFTYQPDSDLQKTKSYEFPSSFNFLTQSLFNLDFQYLNAERIGPKFIFPYSLHHVENLRTLGNSGQFTAHYIAVNKNRKISIPALRHKDNKNLSLLYQLDAWMGEISPGVSISATVNQFLNGVEMRFKFDMGEGFTDEFNSLNVGFGLTYALPVVTAILSSKPGDLLIIENPESHLHPAGQAMIGKLCALAAEAGVQIFIESHSDHILNGIRVAVKHKMIAPENVAVYFFERDANSKGHHVDIINPVIDENGRINRKPKFFFDEWGKQLDELIK